MGVISLTRFETQPGGAAEHLELHMEALGLLQGAGLMAIAMQPLAGGDIGSLAMSVSYASNAEYAASMQKLQADAGWQAFYARAMASSAAHQVESSLFADLDPTYQPSPDRPLGAIVATQWTAIPGRLEEFVGKVIESGEHVVRMGGTVRALQSVIGSHPLSTLVVNGFADLDGHQWEVFWMDMTAAPAQM